MMLSSCRLAATLLLFSLHTVALPTKQELSQLSSRDDGWCPVIATNDFVALAFNASALPPLPPGSKAWVETSGRLQDDDDDNPDWEPTAATKLKERSQAEQFNNNNKDLLIVRQAGPRPFENPNYREIAAQQGILLIRNVAGALGNAAEIQALLPLRAWAGDHIFELNMLTQWLNEYKNGLLTHMITQCSDVTTKVTNILNSVTNLIGVDSVLNGLKMVVLQKSGPRDWAVWPPGVYAGLSNYLDAVGGHYQKVVSELADTMTQLHNLLPLGIPQSVAHSFTDWAMERWAVAVSLVDSHLTNAAGGLTSDWNAIDAPSCTTLQPACIGA